MSNLPWLGTSGVHAERGRYNPSLILAHEVAKALSTSIDELFIFDDGDSED
jgi:DNA-binding XRE family transcriptional regulator